MNNNINLELFLDAAQSGKMPFEQAIMLGIRLAREKGYEEGFETGTVFGYALAMNEMNPAISDGLRHGSPECAKAMVKKRKSIKSD